MAVVLEDGSGVAGANVYFTEEFFESYCEDRGYTIPSGDVPTASVVGCQWLDFTYGPRYLGQPIKPRVQGLCFPRTGVVDASGYYVSSTEVPIEIKFAACEATFRHMTEAGSLAPDLERGGNIKELAAGSVHVVYGANATAQTTFQIIDGILSGLLGSSGGFTARAVRA